MPSEKSDGIHRRYKTLPKNRTRLRMGVRVDVEIGGMKGAAVGRAVDLTEEGIQVRSPHNYGVGERLALSLHIPQFAPQFDFVATVMWIEPAGSTDEFLLGCRFLHTPESHKLLKNLLWEISTGNLPEIQRTPGQKTTRRGPGKK